jgi:ketosteroid isomerase-like protein
MTKKMNDKKTTMTTTTTLGLALLVSASVFAAETNADLQAQVRDRERAFAKTMADRDHAAFASFVSKEAVFIGPKAVLRGRKAVADGWKRFYEGPKAPFSWEPESVEVLDSGTLGLSSGPVRDPEGNRVGTFSSIWRRGPDGKWMIVFDKGCPPCEGSK